MDICVIWAHARNRTAETGAPASWLGAEDLRRFQSVAGRHPVVMGYGTWQAIPRALLAGRQVFVLTQSKTSIPGAVACTSLQEAFTLASVLRTGKVFLLGGSSTSSVYEQGLRVADHVYVANFDPQAEGIELPSLDAKLFELVSEDRTATIGPDRLFQEYRRKRLH
jgi:dihydrofolate reductase